MVLKNESPKNKNFHYLLTFMLFQPTIITNFVNLQNANQDIFYIFFFFCYH